MIRMPHEMIQKWQASVMLLCQRLAHTQYAQSAFHVALFSLAEDWSNLVHLKHMTMMLLDRATLCHDM